MGIIAYKCKRDCNCAGSIICGDQCTSTLHVEHAERDENGEPVVAWRLSDMWGYKIYDMHREEDE